MGGMTWDSWDLYVMATDGSNVLRITNEEYGSLTPPHFGIDGQTIYFSSRIKRQDSSRYSAIFRVSTSDEQPPKNLTPDDQNVLGCAAAGSDPAVSPNGRKIVFISDRKTKYDYDLWIMNLDGSNPTPLNLTQVSECNAFPLFSPNGKEVFFLAKSGWTAESRTLFDLWKAETDGQHPQRVTTQAVALVK
jgi:Tol biopolymer transport system component